MENNKQLLDNLYETACEYNEREELGDLTRLDFDSGEFGIAYTTYDWTDWKPKADAPVWLKEVYEFFKEIDELDAVPMQLSYSWEEQMYEIYVGNDGEGLPDLTSDASIPKVTEALEVFRFDDFCDWTADQVKGFFTPIGYVICDYDGSGMLEIQKNDDSDICITDMDAVNQAIEDGINIIPVEELPIDFNRRYFGWIDTPENRKQIQQYCLEHCNGHNKVE